MPKVSAGLLMYRIRGSELEFFLVHPGGPFFAREEAGVWTIPKGEPEENEPLETAASREFAEETGIPVKEPLAELGSIRQKGGKMVHAWAFQGDWNEDDGLRSNTFEIEWPPRSGQKRSFPEIDRDGFFSGDQARAKINSAQIPLLDRLEERICGK